MSAGLRLALVAPDSLTTYATQLHQSLLHILHRQRVHRERSLTEAATESERETEDEDEPHCVPAEQLPVLSQVSLYIHMPEEATVDFIVRLQQGALPRGLLEQRIGALHGREDEDDYDLHADERDDDEEDEDELALHEEDPAIVQDPPADEREDDDSGPTWRVIDSALSAEDGEDFSDAQSQSLTPPVAPLFTPRHRSEHLQQRIDTTAPPPPPAPDANQARTVDHPAATQADSPRLSQSPADSGLSATTAERRPPLPPPSSACPAIPPLELFRLFPSCWHINLLLYDGLREDIAFSYFQFMQHLSSQIRDRRSPASPSSSLHLPPSLASSTSFYIPPTVLLLYNGWQILQRCEQDEETEERIKKLLNLCDVVVVTDEELCGAYQQLCPNVLVIPHGYHVPCADEDGEDGEGRDDALSPPSSTASWTSSNSSASSVLFSPVPRAPVGSPAGSPSLSPRTSTLHTLLSSSSTSDSSSSDDLVKVVTAKRDRLHAPVLPYIPSPSPPSAIPPLRPSSSSDEPHVHVIGYLQSDDDSNDAHTISWPDVWALRSALLSCSHARASPPLPYLFFLHGAPITGEEEPLVTFLTAAHLEQHYSGSYHDLPSFRRFLYQQSQDGRKVVVVYGLFMKEDVRRLCRALLDFELRITRDVDDGGWVGGRMDRSVPVVLELSSCLSQIRQGATMVVVHRAHPADEQKRDGEPRKGGADDDDDDERGLPVSSGSPVASTLSSRSSSTLSSSFSFSPSYHLYPSEAYDYQGAAVQLLTMMEGSDGVAEARKWNARVMREHSLDVVATRYLAMMDEQLIRKGKGGGGREGAVVTRASWYST